MIINNTGPDGISTVKLFKKLGSTGYGQTLLKRAEKQGLIRRGSWRIGTRSISPCLQDDNNQGQAAAKSID
jgi:hypothetical protein